MTLSDFEVGKIHILYGGFERKEGGINPYYPDSFMKNPFSNISDFFGLFGTTVPTNPGFFKTIAKLLGF